MKKKNQGFTLLEIIIVIIIVGVLASLALPKFFGAIEYSRATEALSSLQLLRSAEERCYLQTTNYLLCQALTDLDVGDPGTAVNAHFTYTIAATSGTGGFTLTASRNVIDGGATSDWIKLQQTSTTVIKTGTGAFGGIK